MSPWTRCLGFFGTARLQLFVDARSRPVIQHKKKPAQWRATGSSAKFVSGEEGAGLQLFNQRAGTGQAWHWSADRLAIADQIPASQQALIAQIGRYCRADNGHDLDSGHLQPSAKTWGYCTDAAGGTEINVLNSAYQFCLTCWRHCAVGDEYSVACSVESVGLGHPLC